MADIESVRAHYDSLETDVLLDLWSRGGQLEWAEKLLYSELILRGISESELGQLLGDRAARNLEIDEQHDMSNFGTFGRLIAFSGGGMLAGLAGSLFGWRAAHATVALVAFGYGAVLIKLIAYLNKNLPEGPVALYKIIRRLIELLVVFGVVVYSALRAAGKA